jgi:hypothetical protein
MARQWPPERDWCLVLDAVSRGAARDLSDFLEAEGVDVDVDAGLARVWCFADDADQLRQVERRVDEVLRAHAKKVALEVEPSPRVWSAKRHRYVDPESPDEDPDTGDAWIDSAVAPDQITWIVRLELMSVFEFRRVCRQLPHLHRPVLGVGNQHIEIGVVDQADAEDVGREALALEGVAQVKTREIRGRFRRWLVRQRLAGNYAVGTDGSGIYYGGGSADGGGGAGNGGGGGHGGHGGH